MLFQSPSVRPAAYVVYTQGFWLRGIWDLSSPTRGPTRPALEGKNLNHLTAGEVPRPAVNKGIK